MLGVQELPRPRDIMYIALGSHEEWKDIEEFEREWAKYDPALHGLTREEWLAKAVGVYNRDVKMFVEVGMTEEIYLKELARLYEVTPEELTHALEIRKVNTEPELER